MVALLLYFLITGNTDSLLPVVLFAGAVVAITEGVRRVGLPVGMCPVVKGKAFIGLVVWVVLVVLGVWRGYCQELWSDVNA